jgi:hypothetical protein
MSPAPFTVLGWQVPDIALGVAALQEADATFRRYPGMPVLNVSSGAVGQAAFAGCEVQLDAIVPEAVHAENPADPAISVERRLTHKRTN